MLASAAQILRRSDVTLSCFILGASVSLLFAELPKLIWLSGIVLVVLVTPKVPIKVLFISALLGLICVTWAAETVLEYRLPTRYEGQELTLSGNVIGLPKQNKQRIKLQFRVTKSTVPQLLEQSIELSCYRCKLNIKANQTWLLTVKLKRPQGYASWGAFDFEKHQFRQGIVARGYIRQKAKNQLLEPAISVWSAHPYRQAIRHYLRQQFSETPVAVGMFAALMMGDKSLLTEQHKQVFQKTGLSHLMAISGLHIGLIFIFCTFFMKYVLWPFAQLYRIWPRQYLVLWPGLLAAFSYAALAGFSVSTQRALIMLLVFSICRLMAKQTTLLHVLLVTAVIVILFDPLSVMDAGFWLSFVAVFIIAINQMNTKTLSLWHLQPLLWLGMLPLSITFFAQAPLLSPLINLLAVPLFCFLLIPLVLIGLFCWLLGWEASSDWLLGHLASVFEFLFMILHKLTQMDFLLWSYPQLQWWHWLFYGVVIGGYLLRYSFRHYTWLLLLLSMLLTFKQQPESGEFSVVILDVGQGLSMVVHTKHHTLVYDTGPRYPSGFSAAKAVLIPYLRYQSVDYLDRLIISHADNDHIGGYKDLADALPIYETLTSRVDKLPHARACHTGQQWEYDGVSFSVLSPDNNTPQGSNNRSCVLKITNQQNSILITGDIEKPVEKYLLKQNKAILSADVLLVPHQGSKTSSTLKFIKAVQPSIGLVAAGYRNHYGHPHPSVMQRYSTHGTAVYSTIDSGSIALLFNSAGITVKQYRQAHKRFWHLE